MPAATVTPDTALSLEVYHLEQSLLDSAMFRSVVANPTAEYAALATWADDPTKGGDTSYGRTYAAAKVAWYEVDEEENPEDDLAAGTRAIIRHGESTLTNLGGVQIRQGGFLVVLLELEVPSAYTATRTQGQKKNLFKWGLSIIGRIERELIAAQNTAGRLTIDRIELDVNQIGVYDRADTARPEDPDVFFAFIRVYHQGP